MWPSNPLLLRKLVYVSDIFSPSFHSHLSGFQPSWTTPADPVLRCHNLNRTKLNRTGPIKPLVVLDLLAILEEFEIRSGRVGPPRRSSQLRRWTETRLRLCFGCSCPSSSYENSRRPCPGSTTMYCRFGTRWSRPKTLTRSGTTCSCRLAAFRIEHCFSAPAWIPSSDTRSTTEAGPTKPKEATFRPPFDACEGTSVRF